jgi:DnaJ like chaperone protein
MRFKGKLIGALVGSLAGPMGTLLGGLLGHLFDRADEEQDTLESLHPGESVTAAQADFLSSLIGLAVIVTHAGGEAETTQVAALKSFFRESFPYGPEDQGTLEWMVDTAYARRRQLSLRALCRHYRRTSSPGGRLLLLRLLFKIAAVGSGCPGRAQLLLIRVIAAELDVKAPLVQSLEAEFCDRSAVSDGLSRDQAYAVLGLPPEAADEVVRSRYRRMAAQHHPDRVAALGEEFTSVAEEKFKLISEAYGVIGRARGWPAAAR